MLLPFMSKTQQMEYEASVVLIRSLRQPPSEFKKESPLIRRHFAV